MRAVLIQHATAGDIAALDKALRALSASMGDTHRADRDRLAAAGFGTDPCFHALLAWSGGDVVGAAVYSPLFSTTRGMAGAYVSDLWVAEALRGAGLGARLLAAVRDAAAARWGAGFLRLGVYADNPRARAFYDRLGFVHAPSETYLTLSGAPLAALKGAP